MLRDPGTPAPEPPPGVAARIDRSLVALIMPGDGESLFFVGSGTLVRLGGMELVFTAAHNVVDDQTKTLYAREKLTVHAPPRHLLLPIIVGGGTPSVARVYVPRLPDNQGDIWPDVAVLELTPEAVLRSEREPFEEDALGFLAATVASDDAWVAGFPIATVDARNPEYAFTPQLVRVVTIPGARHSKEPVDGRGVHVLLGGPAFSHTSRQDVEVPHPRGMSGGPLAVGTDLASLRLVGLATRYRPSREDEWCEPILEAVRLLVDHDKVSVRDAARRLLTTLTALAETAPSPSAER
jgi:hypothetical protein